MNSISRFSILITLVTLASLRAQPASTTTSIPSNSAVQLDPVVVSEKLDKAREEIVPSLGATEYTIDAAQIANQSLGANAGFNQVLLRVPGMAQDSYGQLHLRGEHANLQYRINDVLLPEGISGFGQELDTPFIQTVSLVTGSLPAQYGFRTAGIVDIHTQSAASLKRSGDVTLFGGSFGTLRGNISGAGAAGQLSAFVNLSAQQNDLGIENPTDSRDPIHDRTHQFKFFTDLSYLIDSTSRISLLLSSSFSRFQIPNNPGQDPAFTLDGFSGFDSAKLNENQREENDYAIVAYQKSAVDFSLQLSAFTRYSLAKFSPDWAGDLIFNGVASNVHRDIVSNGIEADTKWAVLPTHTLRSGLLITTTNANTRTTNAVFATDSKGDQASSTPVLIPDNAHKVGWLYGAYVQDEWQPIEHLTINYGLRADASRAYLNEGQISPRLNVVYKFDEATSLHAGYARYFTPPPLELVQTTDLAAFAGTTNESEINASSPVRAERSNYYDVGLSHKFNSDFSASIDGFYKHATSQLDEGQFGAALIFSPFNYRVGHVYGAEIAANYSHEGFSAYANLAVSRDNGQEITSGEFQFGQDEIDYIATHKVDLDHEQFFTASVGASYRFSDTLVYADMLYGSGLRRGFANTEHLPAYYPLNFGVEHTVKFGNHEQLRLRLDVVNLFDEVYQLRDGSGIGVGAPQFGQRRGFFGSVGFTF